MTHEIEVWVCVGDDGSYSVGVDEDTANDAWDNDQGGHYARRIKLTVKVDVPAPLEATIVVPANPGKLEVSVAE
jgi:hypothetical protein